MTIGKVKLVALVAIMLASLLAAVAPVAPVDAAERKFPNKVKWKTCNEDLTAETGAVFECAPFKVPLDYDKPNGKTMTLQLVRIPASDTENRKGAILLNPGGPGGSGVDFVLGAGPLFGLFFGAEAAAQFDLVGFDPRGIQRSTPIRCFPNERQAAENFPPIPFPLIREEIALFQKADGNLASRCANRGQPKRIGPHMSTANVARDMDLIRERMGDEQLNFLGLSYGSYVGATYANLFPERVRSVVVDGVLDPVAWVNAEAEVPFSTRLRSSEGAAETLEEFFSLCEEAAPGNCALAPNSKQRYAAVADALLEAPLELIDPGTGEVLLTLTYQDFIGLSLGPLYNAFAFAGLAQIVAEIELLLTIQAPAQASPGLVAAFDAAPGLRARNYDNFAEGFPAVACADTNNPTDYNTWFEAGEAAAAQDGYFGQLWTWASSPCAQWPFEDEDRFVGPFTAKTANPVLVASTLYDPATRLEGAEALRSLLPNSSLLRADAPGHTTLGLSGCAGFLMGQYFLDPNFAYDIDGFLCPSEFNPFDVVAEPPADQGAALARSARAVADDGPDAAAANAELDSATLREAREAVMAELFPPSLWPSGR